MITLTILLAISACKLKEDRIIPFSEAETIAEIQQALFKATNGKEFHASSMSYYQVEGDTEHFYLKLRYNFDKLSTDDLEEANESLAKISRSLIGLFAKIFFRLGGKYDVKIPPTTIELPEMNYDPEIIKDVVLSKVHLEFFQQSKYNNFKFIKNLDFLVNDEKYGDELILSYTKENNNCDYRCMDLEIYQPSLLKLIADKEELTIKTNLKIKKLPKKIDLTFKGYVELFIKIKLPF